MCQEVSEYMKEHSHIEAEIENYTKLKSEKGIVEKLHRSNLRKRIMYKIIRFNQKYNFPLINPFKWW